MIGAILGLSSAAIFSFNTIVIRRGVLRISPNYMATVSIFSGPPFFLLLALLGGGFRAPGGFPWQATLLWSAAGIIHFALGRTWSYKSIQMIGSNRSTIVTSLNPIVTVALALVVLGEGLPSLMILGILFSLTGPLLIVLKEETHEGGTGPSGRDLDRRTLYAGLLYGAGTALCWGSSAIFIKLALKAGGTPLAGTFISYLAASLVLGPSLLGRKNRQEMLTADRKSLQTAVFSGLMTNVAQLFRFLGLAHGSVIVISLMGRTVPLWVLFFSFLFNRQFESFSRWVLLGNLILTIGTVLVLFA